MRETLKMMKSIVTGKEKEESKRNLIIKYQDKLCPNILAYFYCDNFTLIYRTCKSFNLLSDEDKASFCLQELDNCLRSYDCNCANKFITYFIKCLKNRLITETSKVNSNSNKANVYCNSLIENTVVREDINITDNKLILQQYNLDKEEYSLCELLLRGFTRKEIAIMYKISTPRLSQKLSKIKQKVLFST